MLRSFCTQSKPLTSAGLSISNSSKAGAERSPTVSTATKYKEYVPTKAL